MGINYYLFNVFDSRDYIWRIAIKNIFTLFLSYDVKIYINYLIRSNDKFFYYNKTYLREYKMNNTNIIFYLNGEYKSLEIDPEERVIDVLRETQGLLGTKEGCSDGDCGACTIVIGKIEDGKVCYNAINSCLLPAAKLHKSSVITIEGVKENKNLNIIQESMVEEHGAQCGFCSPGVIMSFFAYFANKTNPSYEEVKVALEGNICRCTGYEGIRNVAKSVINYLNNSPASFDMVPAYLREVENKLFLIKEGINSDDYHLPITINELKEDLKNNPQSIIVSGFTDVGVRKHNLSIKFQKIIDISSLEDLKIVEERTDGLFIGANLPLQRISENEIICKKLPIICEMLSQMASRQVRNVATLGGNICNASPIGDSVVLLMSLDASVILLSNEDGIRKVALRDFYIGYKQMDKTSKEVVIGVLIPYINYEMKHSFIKTGKRNAVDIASVNSASRMIIKDNKVTNWEVSFGGIFETVVYRKLSDITLSSSIEDIEELGLKLSKQFKPLSDVRGSSDYRTLLIQGHLVKHFLKQTGCEV